jgi:HEAT repeat protein
MPTSSFALGLVLVLLPGAPRFAQQDARNPAAAVEAVVAGVERPADFGRAIEELVRLGSPAVAPLFEHLCASVKGDAPLGELRTAAIQGALARLPRDEVLALLTRETRAADNEHRREAGLDLLGRLDGRGDLKLALELGSSGDLESPPGPALLAALERALLGMCEHDESAVRSLAGLFARVAPAAQAVIAAVVRQAGGEAAASLLAAQLGSAGVDADGILLLELGEIGCREESGEDTLVLERVRGLLGHPDSRLRVLACMALEKLRDHEAVPDLVVLLDDDDPNLRLRAHAALRSLTRLRFPADSETWLAWLSDGLAWWDERAEPCRVALVSGTPAEAAASVQELAHQRLFVQHAASILALALQRPEPDVVKSACRALATMPERVTERALLTVVAHPDPTIAAEARAALKRCQHARSSTFRPSPTLPRLRSSLP